MFLNVKPVRCGDESRPSRVGGEIMELKAGWCICMNMRSASVAGLFNALPPFSLLAMILTDI